MGYRKPHIFFIFFQKTLDILLCLWYNIIVKRGRAVPTDERADTLSTKRCNEVTLRRVATEKEIGRLFSPSKTNDRYINQ